jgi:hypothetical protein
MSPDYFVTDVSDRSHGLSLILFPLLVYHLAEKLH